jgi:hypothetical protein
MDNADNAASANTLGYFVTAKRTEFFGHKGRRAGKLVTQFRVGVQIATPSYDFVVMLTCVHII